MRLRRRDRQRSVLRRLGLAAGSALLLLLATVPAAGQPRKSANSSPRTGRPADYRSARFVIHTDLGPDEAKELLTRLETMITLISRYWGQPLKGTIECYVVRDLANWPQDAMDPHGRARIAAGAGVTLTAKYSSGKQFVAKSVVYATADRGAPQHEAVHAYCHQTFGSAGPVWYAEGMAEMGQYWREGDTCVNCHPEVVAYLRETAPKSLNEIINAPSNSGDSWENYASRWALCHLLANNTNYAARFRPLGLGLLSGQKVTFEGVYGPMADELMFEYLFFLQHIELGYRVDLCSWDWKRKFRPLKGTAGMSASVAAARGWQPSGATLAKGEKYEYKAAGEWRTAREAPLTTADGDAMDRGRLTGILLQDWKLGEPFKLGASGEFVAPGDGNLYLRCEDSWVELADNSGQVTVKIKPKAAAAPAERGTSVP